MIKKNIYLQKFKKYPNYKLMKNILSTKNITWSSDNININDDLPQVIFILGLPRSGSTLVETILSCNEDVNSLGEYLGMTKCINANSLTPYFNGITNKKYFRQTII